MEPEDMKKFCNNTKKNKSCSCISIILGILITLLLATIGLILGATYASVLLGNIATLILGIIILGVLTILTFIYKICNCMRRKC